MNRTDLRLSIGWHKQRVGNNGLVSLSSSTDVWPASGLRSAALKLRRSSWNEIDDPSSSEIRGIGSAFLGIRKVVRKRNAVAVSSGGEGLRRDLGGVGLLEGEEIGLGWSDANRYVAERLLADVVHLESKWSIPGQFLA